MNRSSVHIGSHHTGDTSEGKMGIFETLNANVKKLTMVDLKLSQGAAVCLGLVGVKLFPRVLDIHVFWFIGLAIVLYVKPLWVFWMRR